MSRTLEFFEGDDVKFQMEFLVNGTAQTPATATVEIRKTNGTEYLAETAATVVSTCVEHVETGLDDGGYVLYFTADFGDDKRTDTIKFRVKKKDGQQQ